MAMAESNQSVNQQTPLTKTPVTKTIKANVDRQLIALLAVFLGLMAVLFGFLGYQMGKNVGKQYALVATDYRGQKISANDVKSIHLQNEILTQEKQTLTQERDISLNNLTLLQDELNALRQQNEQLIALNQSLSKTANTEPIQVIAMKITNTTDNTYAYRFDVLVADGTGKSLTPTLTLLNPTSLVNVPLTQTPMNSQGVVVIDGSFVMPDGFRPSQIKLTLAVGGYSTTKFYNWQAV